jgi:prepilin-type N-terminal cleavage/methylation domain-containing protein
MADLLMGMGRDRAGFTLVEALVSVAILSVGFAGLYSTIGASMNALERSNIRGQLDAVAQMVLNDLVGDIANGAAYQRISGGNLVPLPLRMAEACGDQTIDCSNRNRWSEQVVAVLGGAADVTLELHALCSSPLDTTCPFFDTTSSYRRSAVITVSVNWGRSPYTARRVVDLEGGSD